MWALAGTLLVVTVNLVGGPHGHGGAHRGVTELAGVPGVTVGVSYPTGRLATVRTDRHGRAYLRVIPGTYQLTPQHGLGFCSTTSVHVHGRVMRVRLYCSIR